MAYPVFNASCLLKPQFLSIKEVSVALVEFLINLSEKEGSALLPVFVMTGRNVEVSINKNEQEIASKIFADLLFAKHKNSINKDLGFKVESIHIKRKLSWTGALIINDQKGNQIFQIYFGFGGFSPNILIRNFSKGFIRDFDWYLDVLKILTRPFTDAQALHASIKLRSTTFFEKIKDIKGKFTLGWINYFDDDYEVTMPDNLEGYESEKNGSGRIFILTKKDFTADRKDYLTHCDLMIDNMRRLINEVPEYTNDSGFYSSSEKKEYNSKYPRYEVPGINLDHKGKVME